MNKAFFFLLTAGAFALAGHSWAAALRPPYPYGSPSFTRIVADSYAQIHATDPQTFYTWMDKDCQRIALGVNTSAGRPMFGWSAVLQQKKREIDRAHDPARKAQEEMQIAAWLHKTIKKAVPRFSLDEGFEFTNMVRKGERQCVLQSVLMAGLMQAIDMDAGMVMVYKNIAGQSTNNGHAATLLKRADGKDVLVDCSEPTPFARHQGLFVADAMTGRYRYVDPMFVGTGTVIVGYKPEGEAKIVVPREVRPLDYQFVRSQFDYYRGERAVGGLLAPHPTWAGLEAEAQHLRTSIAVCPQNPLSVYMLGRVYLKQSKLAPARRQLAKAYVLYSQSGWVPPGCRDAMAEAKVSQAKL